MIEFNSVPNTVVEDSFLPGYMSSTMTFGK